MNPRDAGSDDRPVALVSYSPAAPFRARSSVRAEKAGPRQLAAGEARLRRNFRRYADDYGLARTLRSLAKVCLLHRPVRAVGAISSSPVLVGLRHVYGRTLFSAHTGGEGWRGRSLTQVKARRRPMMSLGTLREERERRFRNAREILHAK